MTVSLRRLEPTSHDVSSLQYLVPATPRARDTLCLRCAKPLLILFLYSAQLAAAKNELRAAQEASSNPSISPPPPARIEKPRNLSKINLQAAMGLTNNPEKYRMVLVSPHSY